jgi:hypothetical protein
LLNIDINILLPKALENNAGRYSIRIEDAGVSSPPARSARSSHLSRQPYGKYFLHGQVMP